MSKGISIVWLDGARPHPLGLIMKLTEKNEGKSAASFWRQVAAWVPDMFYNFYLVKNHTEAREK
jgi:hypothetical protein